MIVKEKPNIRAIKSIEEIFCLPLERESWSKHCRNCEYCIWIIATNSQSQLIEKHKDNILKQWYILWNDTMARLILCGTIAFTGLLMVLGQITIGCDGCLPSVRTRNIHKITLIGFVVRQLSASMVVHHSLNDVYFVQYDSPVVKTWNPKTTFRKLKYYFLRLFFLCCFRMKTVKLVWLFIFWQ